MSNDSAPLASSGQPDAPQPAKKPRSKANGSAKKRSQPKTTRRPATPPPTASENAQPASMPAEMDPSPDHEQREAELKEAAERHLSPVAKALGEALAKAEAARQEAQRQEAMRREAERRAAQQQALARHRLAIAAIDGRERQALNEFDTRRRTWAGRAVEIVKGKQHFDTQRKAIMDAHEAERMTLRRASSF
jgi:colicin import membrane protein